MSCGVYSIIHTMSGKAYIGSTKNINIRWRRHKNSLRRGNHHCSHLQRAWRKHGESSFEFKFLETVADTGRLIDREQVHMDATPNRYNTCPKAGSCLGMRLTQEQRDKISAAHTGRRKSITHRAALSEAQRIRAMRPDEQERIARFAMNRKGSKNTQEHRNNAGIGIRATIANRISYLNGGNPAARKCRYGEQIFTSVKEASESTGLSLYKLKRSPLFSYIS